MASVNKVILLGNCGKDPEVRYAPSGMAIASVSLATSSKRKDKNTGETIEDTQWHRLVFYDRLAEIVGEYVAKGSSIYVEGRLKYGQYEKDGVTRYTTDIVVEQLQLLSSKERSGGGNETRQEAGQRRSQGAERSAPPQRQAPAPRSTGGSGFDDMDDDIPF